jgi:ribonuclease HI
MSSSILNKFVMKFDGCSKGNPGLSGAGAVIYCDDNEIWSGVKFVGINATNNQAEYTGLIVGLTYALENQIEDILVQGDSQLIIYQMTGKYKCNSTSLIELYKKAKALEEKFKNVTYQHIYRKYNSRADHLSNIAVQQHVENVENIV